MHAGGTQRLSRLVGIGKAKELIFTAKVLSGQEASQIGLVEHAVSQNGTFDAAYEKALELAKAIIANVRLYIENGVFCFYLSFLTGSCSH